MAGESPTALPTVSVVFLTKNRPRLIARSLAAVLDDRATTEAIVVIDGEDTETREVLERFDRDDPRVKLTALPPPGSDRLENMQRGRDHGARLASSDVVLGMDDDVVAHPGLVAGHARWHARHDDLVVVGYMPVVTQPRWPGSHAPVRFYAGAYEASCQGYRADPSTILTGLWGGNYSVRKTRWLEAIAAGRVPSYHEDKEFGVLLLRAGMRGIFDSTLRGDHHYERSLNEFVGRAEVTEAAHAHLWAAYPDELGFEKPSPERPELRALIRISRSSLGWRVVRSALLAAIRLAALLRLSKLEDRGVHVLWRVAAGRGSRVRGQEPV